MAIIKCPECSTDVSDKAEKCPKCAYPISGQSVAEKVQTIEKTSKQFKKQLIFAAITIIVGFVIMISNVSNGSNGGAFFGGFLTFIGIVWILAVKIKIWWHHE